MQQEIYSVRLKDFYKLGEKENSNYILSLNDEKCVYLNSSVALVLKILLSLPDSSQYSDSISDVFGIEKKKAERIVNNRGSEH